VQRIWIRWCLGLPQWYNGVIQYVSKHMYVCMYIYLWSIHIPIYLSIFICIPVRRIWILWCLGLRRADRTASFNTFLSNMYICIHLSLSLSIYIPIYLFAYLCEESESCGVWVCVLLTEWRHATCIQAYTYLYLSISNLFICIPVRRIWIRWCQWFAIMI